MHACLENGAEPHTWQDTAFLVPVIKFIGKEVPREIHRDLRAPGKGYAARKASLLSASETFLLFIQIF